MTLRTLLHGYTLLLSAAGFAATAFLASFTDSLEDAAMQMGQAIERINASERLGSQLLFLNSERYLAALTGGELRLAGKEARTQLEASLRDIDRYLGGGEEQRLVERIRADIAEFDARWDRAMEESLQPTELYVSVATIIESAYRSLERLIELNLEQARAEQRAIAARNQAANWLAAATAALLLLAAVSFFVGLRMLVYRPLAALVRRIRRFEAARERSIDPRWPEEIREIAHSFEEMRQALADQEQRRLQFLAGVAHDLRSPLNAMSLAADLLAGRALGEDERERRAGTLKRQVRHLSQMLQDLLDTAQIEAGKLSLAPAETDLKQVVRDAVELFSSLEEDERLHVVAPTEACSAVCDPVRIGQVLNNLLSNAIKYSPRGGAITVALREAGESVEISVADQGVGIDPAEQESIFEPYRRSAGTRQAFPGVGLGLSVSRRIVHGHGGTIAVESRPGRGAKFTVRIPKRPPQ